MDDDRRLELDRYNYRSESIRENLVPSRRWIRELLQSECWGPFQIDYDAAFFDRDDVYMAPYYHRNDPYFQHILEERVGTRNHYDEDDVKALQPEDILLWKEELDHRMAPYLQFRIDDETLSIIDADPDVFAVLFQTSGAFIALSYRQLQSLDVVSFSNAAKYCVIGNSRNPTITDDLRRRMMELCYDRRDEFDAWLHVTCREDCSTAEEMRDRYYPMSRLQSLSVDDLTSLKRYIQLMLESRAKVLKVF